MCLQDMFGKHFHNQSTLGISSINSLFLTLANSIGGFLFAPGRWLLGITIFYFILFGELTASMQNNNQNVYKIESNLQVFTSNVYVICNNMSTIAMSR